ncbi:MAG: AraC family transcriptional regulator [bacterium]|nr:AraC family transcriptional regulator [bacterium]
MPSDDYIKPVHAPVLMLPDDPPIIVSWERAVYNSLPLTYHREAELQFVKQGLGSYFIQDRNYAFKKNSLIVIRPNEVHRLIPHPDLRIEKCTIIFPETLLDDDSKLTCFPADFPRHICLSERDATDIEVILRSIEDERRYRRHLWLDVITTDLKKLILYIRRNGARENDDLPESENELVRKIVNYIETDFAQEITLNSLSEIFSLSPSYLSRLFKKCIGLNLKHYVLQRRIIEAKRLLENDPMIKVSSIPQIVGFHDFPVFNQNFKQITGLTPSAYRKIMDKHDK